MNKARTKDIYINSHPDKNLDEKQSQDSRSFPVKRSFVECSVDRSLALTLYVSRFFGVAPVSFKKKRNSIFVSVSPTMYAYSSFLLFILHASITSGLVLDFNVDSDRSVRVRSATSSLAWLTEVLVVTVLMTVGVYKGPERMNDMIKCLNIIEKVNSKIHKHRPGKHIERVMLIIGILYLLIGNSLYLFDFYTFVYEGQLDEKDMKVIFLYLSFYLEYMATFSLELQFMDIVLKIVSAQRAINNALTVLVSKIALREKRNSTVKVIDFDYPFDNANVEAHESFLNTAKCVKESACQIPKKDTELFRYLMVSYGNICDVVRQTNDSNAVHLILLLLSFFLHLIISPYYLISFWASTKHWEASAKLQIFMCIFHTINMMIVVEPAHRSTEEMKNTKALLGQLARRITSSSELLTHELDLFYKQIVLNPVSFMPMGICTLTRSIVTTIFGGVTTYLVIILQFRALDKQSW